MNVVYNPDTQTWVRADSPLGQDIPTSTNPQFGLTAEEVKSKQVRQAREERAKQIEEQKDQVISTIEIDNKTTKLRSSKAFAEKLKKSVAEENIKRQQERNKQIQKLYSRKSVTNNEIQEPSQPSSIIPIKTTEPKTDKLWAKNLNLDLKSTYTEAKKGEEATFITSNPVRSGVVKGAKNVGIGLGVSAIGLGVAVTAPATAPALAVAGKIAFAGYAGKTYFELKKDPSTERIAQTTTEGIGFAVIGAGLNKITPKLQQTYFEKVKIARSNKDLFDKTKYWGVKKEYTAIKDNKGVIEIIKSKPPGFKVDKIQNINGVIKQSKEIQTQLIPKKKHT